MGLESDDQQFMDNVIHKKDLFYIGAKSRGEQRCSIGVAMVHAVCQMSICERDGNTKAEYRKTIRNDSE